MTSRRIVSLVSLLTSLIAFVAVTVTLTHRPEPDAAAFRSCISERALDGRDLYEPAEKECITDVLYRSARAGDLAQLADAMNDLNARNLPLCHIAAHAAGAKLWTGDGDWRTKVMLVDTSVCNSGMLHGVFDAMAKQEYPEQTWVAVATWCADHKTTFASQGNCTDALGHAAWDSRGERAAAYRICSYLGIVDKTADCVEGVEMQRYTPVSRPDGWSAIDLSDIAGLCADVPQADQTGLRLGCVRGFAYLAYSGLSQRNTDDVSRSEFYDITDRYNATTVSLCSSYETGMAEACVEHYFWLAKYMYPQEENTASIERFCTPLREWRKVCAQQFVTDRT